MGSITFATAGLAYLILVSVMGTVTFLVYGWDKQQAIQGGRRVTERTLHALAFFGGWPGAIFGQRYFRHKTKKIPFLILFWAVTIFHLAIVASAAYALFR